MTTNQLYKLLRENNFQETERLEFKREFPKNAGDLCKSFAAFANGNGGVFLIGVEDKDGEVVGIKNSDETMRRVTSALRDSIRPSIHPEIGSIDIGGGAFVVWAKVSADPSVHFCNEKIYTRVGSETRAVIDEHALLRLMNRGSAEASSRQPASSASSPSSSASVFSEPSPFGIDAHLLEVHPIKSDEALVATSKGVEVKSALDMANAKHPSVSAVVVSQVISDSEEFGQDEQLHPISRNAPTDPFSTNLADNAVISPVTYKATRLLFRASVIEPLLPDEAFRIVTPDGTFQMTKAEFYRDFANVVASASYRENGIYHSASVPKKAFQYRVE